MSYRLWDLNDLLVKHALLVRSQMRQYRRTWSREIRETTITDFLMLSLQKKGRGLVTVAPPPTPEDRYGADLELWLRGGGFLLGLRLQAKSLHPRKTSDGVYRYLPHFVGSRLQSEILVRATHAPLNPGYLFYNGLERKPKAESNCCSFNGYSKRHGRLALTYCGGRTVLGLQREDPSQSSLDDLLPLSVPLQCLVFCHASLRNPTDLPLPLRAVDWPLSLARSESPYVVLDPLRPTSEADLARAHALDLRIFDGDAPAHLTELLEAGRIEARDLPDSDRSARWVVVVDGDEQ